MNLFAAIIQEMRIKQWTKNILVYSALLFSGGFFVELNFWLTTLAFISFCFASSGVYFFNDIFDVANDRSNPKKCHRPIAAGLISIRQSYTCATGLFALGLLLSYLVNVECLGIVVFYIFINIAYTLRLKHVVIVDVMIIAVGFVLRALMGVAAINSGMTMWFILCVMFLSLFLALGKRRHELVNLEKDELCLGRKVLQFYSAEFIDQMMTIVTSALLICYALFTVDVRTSQHELMACTIPLVLYGMFYYLYVVRIKRGGGAPDEALYREKPILVVVLLYFASVILIRNI